MSTLQVRNVESPDGGISDNLLPVTASAWVNFNGTGTVAITDSYNVSSITDNGTGDYTANFSTALSNTSYGVLITSSTITATVSQTNLNQVAEKNLGSTRIVTTTVTPTTIDRNSVAIAIFGGQ